MLLRRLWRLSSAPLRAPEAEGYQTVLYGLPAGAVLVGLALNAAVSACGAIRSRPSRSPPSRSAPGTRLRHHEPVPAVSPGS